MGKIISYFDSDGKLWSRVKFESGEKILIKVLPQGVTIAKLNWWLTRSKIYIELAYDAAKTAQIFDSQIKQYCTPSGIKHPLLRVFTQAALESNSLSSFSIRLDMAICNKHQNNIPPYKFRNNAHVRDIIIRDYAKYIEHDPPAGEIRDVTALPHPKHEILDVIYVEIAQSRDNKMIEILKAGALMLADFQDNVGKIPLTLLGISEAEKQLLVNSSTTHQEQMAIIAKIANNPMRDKCDLLTLIAGVERQAIMRKLSAAAKLREQALY